MIDIEGICTIDGKNEETFTTRVEEAIRNNLISDMDEAIRSFTELAKGKEGIAINEQIGLDNELGVEILIETWRDDIARELTNRVYKVIFKAIQVVSGEKIVAGPNNTTSVISQTNVVCMLKIQNDDDTFYNWTDYESDVVIGSIKAEGDINKRKLQHIVRDKVYTMGVASKGPENLFPFFSVDERCKNAQEVSHSFPDILKLLVKLHGEPVPITETPGYVTTGFELKLIKGKVSGIKNPKQGKTSMSFNIADSSVSIDDINNEKFGAYLRVVTNINTISAQGFGNNSYVYILTKVIPNTPLPGREELPGLGVLAFYPMLILPIVRRNQETIPSGTNTVGVDAGNVIDKLSNVNKGIPTPSFPKANVQPSSIPSTPATPATPPTPSAPPTSGSRKGSSKLPVPNQLKPDEPETGKLTESEINKGISECKDFGKPDDSDPGCMDCLENHKETYNNCKTYSETSR